jgi:putative addiction module component (TIGR02574 family)
MPTNFDPNLLQLAPSQKLEIIGWLWDSLPNSLESLPIPDSHRDELERRITTADANPAAAIPWEEVRDQLRRKP